MHTVGSLPVPTSDLLVCHILSTSRARIRSAEAVSERSLGVDSSAPAHVFLVLVSHDLLDDITSSTQHRGVFHARNIVVPTRLHLPPHRSLPPPTPFHYHKGSHPQWTRPLKYPLLELLPISISPNSGISGRRDVKSRGRRIGRSGAKLQEHSRGIVVDPETKLNSLENTVAIEISSSYEQFRMSGRWERQCAEREVDCVNLLELNCRRAKSRGRPSAKPHRASSSLASLGQSPEFRGPKRPTHVHASSLCLDHRRHPCRTAALLRRSPLISSFFN